MEIPAALLTKLVVATASTLAEQVELSPEAEQLLTPDMSSEDLVKTLADRGLNTDVVSLLAHGLEQQQGVRWAAESAKMVADKLPPAEVEAMEAAEAWVQGAAAEADLQQTLGDPQAAGPGSWAAQAALWTAQALESATPEGDIVPLAAKAIEGAVILAAGVSNKEPPLSSEPDQAQEPMAILADAASEIGLNQLTEQAGEAADGPIDPEILAAFNQILEPFAELGLRLAADQL
jgi:hypothetical protein